MTYKIKALYCQEPGCEKYFEFSLTNHKGSGNPEDMRRVCYEHLSTAGERMHRANLARNP